MVDGYCRGRTATLRGRIDPRPDRVLRRERANRLNAVISLRCICVGEIVGRERSGGKDNARPAVNPHRRRQIESFLHEIITRWNAAPGEPGTGSSWIVG